jgi:hypothetical protein
MTGGTDARMHLYGKPRIVVKFYGGSPSGAARKFQRDARSMAARGYVPVSQSYAQGSWGCAGCLLLLLLAITVVGILLLLLGLIWKPGAGLTVTYQLQEPR